jgi:hypothetical protein
MRMKIQIKGLEKIGRKLAQFSAHDLPRASVAALNDTAFTTRKAMQDTFRSVFDRVTPYVVRSVLVKKATVANLVAEIKPTYIGGKGIDPQKILAAQVRGGRRSSKRSEVALERAGILPKGWLTVLPKSPFPGSHDGRGNLKGSFAVRLLSYFHAFGEVGFSANMTGRTRARLEKKSRSANGYKMIGGVQFFVSHGKRRSQHLPAGIWAKTGIHGVDVRPVLMFVRHARYRSRVTAQRIVADKGLQGHFEKRLRYQIRRAIERTTSGVSA